MGKSETSDVVVKLQTELELSTDKFTTKHSKATNDAIKETQKLIGVWKSAQEVFASIPTPSQLAKSKPGAIPFKYSKKYNAYTYMNKPLMGGEGENLVGADMFREAERIRAGEAARIRRLRQDAIVSANKAAQSEKMDKFFNVKASLDEKLNLGETIGFSFKQYNRGLYEAGVNAGMSAEQLKKFMKAGDGTVTTMKKIFDRAIVTVPVWMAIRNAIQFATGSIDLAVTSIINMDRELARIKTVTDDVPNIGKFLEELGSQARKMSMETGASIEDILHSFYGFKDAGLSTEVAFAGMNVSVKGAIALFGDIKETAKTLTDVYVLLGDKIEGAVTPQEKMERIMTSIAVLQKTNKFELSEYIEGLKNFASTAGNSNLTLDQMAFLLAKTHNFMQRGSRGGTELSRAFREITKSVKETGILLGEAINLDTVDKFTLMLKVMEELNKRWSEGRDITGELNTIFGVIGSKAIGAYVIKFKEVIKEWKAFSSLSPERRMEVLNDQFNTATLTLERQASRFEKIRTQLAASFIAGFFGMDLDKTKDAAENFQKINNSLEKMVPALNKIGEAANPFIKLLTLVASLGGIAVIGKFLTANPLLSAVGAGIGVGEISTMAGKSKSKRISGEIKAFGKSGISYEDLVKKGVLVDTKEAKTSWEEGYNELLDEQRKVIEESEKIPENLKSRLEVEKDISGFYEYRKILLDRLNGLGYTQLDIEKAHLELIIQSTDIQDKDKAIFDQKLKILKEQIQEENKGIERRTQYQFLEAERMKIYGASEIDIQRKKIELQNDYNKKKDEELKLQGMINDEALAYSETIQSSLKGSFKDILSGKGNASSLLGNLNNTMIESFRDTVANSLSKVTMSTGIGDIFGKSMMTLGQRIESAHKIVYDIIKKGHVEGMREAMGYGGGSSGTASWQGSTSVGGAAFFNNDTTIKSSALGSPQNTSYGAGGMGTTYGGYLSPSIAGKKNADGKRIGGSNSTQALQTGVSSALTGYSAYASARAGGASTGKSVMQGLGVTLMMIPTLPTIIIGALLLIGSLFMKDKKSSSQSVDYKTTENKISSKIEVTNKNLEIINRNLIGLRTDMRSYILPQSAYWSTKDSLDSEFSLSSRRGVL